MIQNLEEINKELKIAHDKRKEEKKKEYDARNLITPNEKRNARIEKLKTEEQCISLKKRNTVKIFKEMKVFLKDLLPKISTATNEGRMTLLVLTSIDLSNSTCSKLSKLIIQLKNFRFRFAACDDTPTSLERISKRGQSNLHRHF